jgi:parallel beta-helix repeat protein
LGNAKDGIGVDGKNSSPMILGNTVQGNSGHGVHVSGGASPSIVGNTITGNALGAILADAGSSPILSGNVADR